MVEQRFSRFRIACSRVIETDDKNCRKRVNTFFDQNVLMTSSAAVTNGTRREGSVDPANSHAPRL
jgi:hypothetical protein